jgi:hypothetical protein
LRLGRGRWIGEEDSVIDTDLKIMNPATAR